MAHSYSHLFGIPVTGMRFFTVYGPWGRPDMAYFSFTKALFDGSPIALYNHGRMKRDFTYVDDIVEAVVRLMDHPPSPDPSWSPASGDPSRSSAPYRLFNLGNTHPVELGRFLAILEQETGRRALTTLLPMQPGDMEETFADLEGLADVIDFHPATSLEEGLKAFVGWYRGFYGVEGTPVL
jgi:UDP-glucuronate 4-epimerase